MNRTLMLSFALAAGWLGGAISRYVTPTPAFAESSAPKQVVAQSFVLSDDKNNVVGVFKLSEPQSDRAIVLVDRNGREIWRAPVAARNLSWVNGK
jgi:hypothetical protein